MRKSREERLKTGEEWLRSRQMPFNKIPKAVSLDPLYTQEEIDKATIPFDKAAHIKRNIEMDLDILVKYLRVHIRQFPGELTQVTKIIEERHKRLVYCVNHPGTPHPFDSRNG